MKLLKDLTQFKHAIAYTFEPETPNHSDEDDQMLAIFGQYKDLFEGYLHAQDVVLPAMKAQGLDKLTPEMIVGFIKAIHQRFAFSLLHNKGGVQSGEFLDSLVAHWHHGGQMQSELSLYLLERMPRCTTEAQLLDYFEKNYPQLERRDVQNFVHLLRTMMNDPKKPIHPSYAKYMLTEGSSGKIGKMFNRLATAWHEQTLSSEERVLVAKFLWFVRYPHLIQPSMHSLATSMLERWKSIDTQDINAFSELLADVYQQMVAIHPFVNANKRTARCWINIMLRFSGYEDIMLQPRDEDTSSIAREIIVPRLAEDVRTALAQAAIPSTPNETSSKLFDLRLINLDLFQQLKRINPLFNLTKFTEKVYYANPLLQTMHCEAHTTQLLTNQLILAEGTKILESLKPAAPAPKPQQVACSSTAGKNTAFKGGFFTNTEHPVKVSLQKLTSVANWKITPNGLTFWNEFAVEEDAKSALNLIKNKDFCSAKLSKHATANSYIVKLDAVDSKKLFAQKPVENTATM